MPGKFDDACLPLVILANDAQPSTFKLAAVRRIQTVVAMILLNDTPAAVDRGRAAGRLEKDWCCLTDQRATERRDYRRRSVRIRLGMASIVNSRDVTREFENSMLEAPAHAEEGKSRVTSMTNGGEGALGARIGARRREPDRGGPVQVRTPMGNERGGR